MTLQQWASGQKTQIFDALTGGHTPPFGEFDDGLLKDAMAKGRPQAGTTVFSCDHARFEFIYPNANGAPIVFSVVVASPERIVFLPVPEWVVESIWQGEVDGSFQFESDANTLLEKFKSQLEPSSNAVYFEKPLPRRRE